MGSVAGCVAGGLGGVAGRGGCGGMRGVPCIGRRAAVKNAGPSNLSGHAALFLSPAMRRFDSHPHVWIAPSTIRNVPDILASGHVPASRTGNATHASA